MNLNNDEIIQTFMDAKLEGNYNFLRDDLVKLAHAFVNAAKDKIIREEREECIEFVRSLNSLVADKLADKRNAL